MLAACGLGHAAMGLADRNTVAGVVRAWSQSRLSNRRGWKACRLPYHPGCRLVFCDGTPDILAYPRDRAGLGQSLPAADPGQHARREREGRLRIFIATTCWNGATACRSRSCPIVERTPARASHCCSRLKERFGERCPARRRARLCRQRPLPARPGGGPGRRGRHAADGDQRRALSRRRAPPAAGRADRDPAQDHRSPRPASSSRPMPSGTSRRRSEMARLFRAPSAGARRDAPLCRRAGLLAAANSSTIIPTSRPRTASTRRRNSSG